MAPVKTAFGDTGGPVTVHTDTEILRFEDGRALARSSNAELDLGSFDTVVVAVGTRPTDSLSAALRERGVDVEVIGDAHAIGQIEGAVTSAWETRSLL